MCGIAGFMGFEDKGLLQRMIKLLRHRGPDKEGFFFGRNVSLGNARLSIIDLKGGKQPIYNEGRDIAIVFNGEIYNYQALRGQLERQGHSFYTESDTEAIVHCYEQHGPAFLEKLDGMFAFALWDSKKKQLLLGRDRLGIKPLYYIAGNGKLLFASELKSLLQYKEFKPRINYTELSRFLALRVTSNSNSMIEGIGKLSPGHFLAFKQGAVSISSYWKGQYSEAKGTLEYYSAKYRQTLKESVQSHLQSDVPLGVFLSGGLDSSALVALAASHSKGELNTCTAGFGLEGDEFPFAKRVAAQFSTNHSEITVSMDSAVSKFPEIVYYLDEPCADPAIFATFLISKAIRKKFKVALLGEGNDELFAGYSHYKIGSNYFSALPEYFKGKAYEYFLQRQAFSLNKIEKLLKGNSGETRNFYKLPDGPSFLNKMLLKELIEFLPNMQLQRVDRMTMASGLEARVPFLSNAMIELALKVPSYLKLNGFKGKFLARKAMRGFLPKEVLSGKKRVFFTPLGEMMRQGLLELCESTLLSKESLFDKIESSQLIEKFKRNKEDEFVARKLWMLLMVEKWKERLGVEK